jgi:cell wall-associated NlpC family hydrolase
MEGLSQILARISEIQRTFPAPAQTSSMTASPAWASAAASVGLGQSQPPSGAPTAAVAVNEGTALPGSAAGSSVVDKARQYLGVPYLWGGTDPTKGLDCSGFTQLVYKSQGVDLPRVSSQQATAGRPVASLAEARPGDLLFFDYSPSRPGIDHVGIYVGEGQMIAAPQPGDVVKVQQAGQPTVIRRVLPDGTA